MRDATRRYIADHLVECQHIRPHFGAIKTPKQLPRVPRDEHADSNKTLSINHNCTQTRLVDDDDAGEDDAAQQKRYRAQQLVIHFPWWTGGGVARHT